ncbi:biliverdin-producing heme oxygenase [Microbacterium sp. NPDC057650]|uniref:biliverdin-producing heme oxygenase n=1 Tax=unclassified Microbacterium TaxID=2609290 RepID=UPI00367340B3
MLIDDTVIDAVTAHMNGDHAADNLLIARAFGAPEASGAVMVGLDDSRGRWQVDEPHGLREIAVAWPIEITERRDIRRAAVELYRAACARLGVEPRAEEQRPAHHDHIHGARAAATEETPGFARELREATWGDHGDSEGAEFMTGIMRGRGTRADYTQLVVQHWYMYEALERASALLSADPLLAGVHPPALLRRDALISDLETLIGPEWRDAIEAVPATVAYAQRIDELAEQGSVAGILAHHYTRYLGDLSGGQVIARRVSRQFGGGVSFYDFSAIDDVDEFKAAYRRTLDAFGKTLDASERARMLDEVRSAYRFNTEVFADLGRARALA